VPLRDVQELGGLPTRQQRGRRRPDPVRLVADSHAVIWYAQGSARLSAAARDALTGAEADGGIVISTATLIDLWYVTQTTQAIGAVELRTVRSTLLAAPTVDLHPWTPTSPTPTPASTAHSCASRGTG